MESRLIVFAAFRIAFLGIRAAQLVYLSECVVSDIHSGIVGQNLKP